MERRKLSRWKLPPDRGIVRARLRVGYRWHALANQRVPNDKPDQALECVDGLDSCDVRAAHRRQQVLEHHEARGGAQWTCRHQGQRPWMGAQEVPKAVGKVPQHLARLRRGCWRLCASQGDEDDACRRSDLTPILTPTRANLVGFRRTSVDGEAWKTQDWRMGADGGRWGGAGENELLNRASDPDDSFDDSAAGCSCNVVDGGGRW